MCHEPQTFQLNDVGFNHGLIDRRHRSRSRRRRRSLHPNATLRVPILYYFPFTFVYFSLGSPPAALHSFHSSSLVTVDAPCLPLCFFSFFFFWSRRRRWWRRRRRRRRRDGGDGWRGGPPCASVSQTCSNNGLYYLLLFAVRCSQAPDSSLSRGKKKKRQRFSLAFLLLLCDGDGLWRNGICRAAGGEEVGWSCLLVMRCAQMVKGCRRWLSFVEVAVVSSWQKKAECVSLS